MEALNLLMVHDSVRPKAWNYYEKDGICLIGENDYSGRITKGILVSFLSRLEEEILELYG